MASGTINATAPEIRCFTFTGTSGTPTTNNIDVPSGSRWIVYAQRTNQSAYLGGLIVQAAGAMNLVDLAGNSDNTQFKVAAGANNTLVVTAKTSGIAVTLIGIAA